VEDQVALTWVSGHRILVATANPIFACKDALHNRDDGAMFIRSQGSSYGTS